MKKESKKKTKKNGYFKEVGKELSKVKWPERKDIIKYTIATVIFVLIVVAFFLVLTMGMSWIVELF